MLLTLTLVACAPEAPPTALVYRGPAACDGCGEAVAHLLNQAEPDLAVTFVGPEDTALTEDLLATATVYAQPGGNGTVEDAWSAVGKDADLIVDYVQGGGRYLGFCMGGYLAGTGPGFGLLPGQSWQYIATDGADVRSDVDTVVEVDWEGEDRWLYFQDGPSFTLFDDADATVFATYVANDEIAALVAPSGAGRVAVSGPHPEATADWFSGAGVTDPDGLDTDLGTELVLALLR